MDNGFRFSFYLDNSLFDNLNLNRGLKIYILTQINIYPVFFNDIQPWIVTNIGLRLKYSQRLSSPYTNCIHDLTSTNANQTTVMIYMFSVLNISQYTFRLCENIVFTKNLKQAFDCSNKSYLMNDLSFICHTTAQIDFILIYFIFKT